MQLKEKKNITEKETLHPRNRHRSRYDFKMLINEYSGLSEFVYTNEYQNETIDFSNPDAVKALNKALLKAFYHISFWDIPANFLCPPVPGRADYIHYIADLLSTSNNGTIPTGKLIRMLDIGCGANCIYPIIASDEYEWSVVGSEIESLAIESAKKIILSNPSLSGIEVRKQSTTSAIFKGIIKPEEFFDVTICNPPFHSSLAEAMEGTTRKVKNLSGGKVKKTILNFGGQQRELWCKGGEKQFLSTMIKESALFSRNCLWFTSLVSKSSNLSDIYAELEHVNAHTIKTIEMKQGNKISRLVAWTFLNTAQQAEWRTKRFNKN